MKKILLSRIILTAVSLFLMVALCSCTLIFPDELAKMEDTNGADDHSLAILTEEDICVKGRNQSTWVSHWQYGGECSYNYWDAETDRDTVLHSAKKMNGVSTLQMTYGKEDTITFTVECERTEGNLRVVLIDSDNWVILHNFSIEGKSTYTVSGAKGKTYEIRIAGEAARFEITATREYVESDAE